MAQVLVENVDHVPPEIEETTKLITASGRAERDSQEVILISKDGRSFFNLESRHCVGQLANQDHTSFGELNISAFCNVPGTIESKLILPSQKHWYLSTVDYIIISSPSHVYRYHRHHLAMLLCSCTTRSMRPTEEQQ